MNNKTTKIKFLYDAKNKQFEMKHDDPEMMMVDLSILTKRFYDGIEGFSFDSIWDKMMEIGLSLTSVEGASKKGDKFTLSDLEGVVNSLIPGGDDTYIFFEVDSEADIFNMSVTSTNIDNFVLGLATLYFTGIVYSQPELDIRDVESFREFFVASCRSVYDAGQK